MLGDIPQELLLAILSNLGVSDILNLRLVCKAWDIFINENEFAVFRGAAIFGLNVPSSTKLVQDLRGLYSPRILVGVSTWKELCVRLIQIKKSWRGKAQSTITSHRRTGDSGVHRFKIDEKAEIIIATTTHGGLYVTDLNASKWYHGRVQDQASPINEDFAHLWTLPDSFVRPCAHCEYDHGYLIFDRFGGSKEVWRLTEYDIYYPTQSSGDETSPTVIADARPDDDQRRAYELSQNLDPYVSEQQRSPRYGKFTPWALLHPPTPTRAFRFIYPTLLVVSFARAYMYDVRTGKLVQVIDNLQTAQPILSVSLTGAPTFLGHLNYVDHSPQHLFICGEGSLRVFSRQTGQCVYGISSTFGNYGCSRWKIGQFRNESSRSLNCMGAYVDADPFKAFDKADTALYRHDVVREIDRTEPYSDQIVAAHVSSCGKYLTVLFETSRILIIRDLERLFKGEVSLFDSTIEVQLGKTSRFSTYHSFENGRVGVATRNGVFIVVPHPSFFSSEPLSSSTPPSILRVHALNDPFTLQNISCLQMTESGLYVTWSPECPLTSNVPPWSEAYRMQIYDEQEDVFWKGLEEYLEPNQGMLTGGDEASVVLSVDFVPT
ncbi:hypothetical protein F5887DRAFT_1019634 [Amanita rubescens]|nr:hypothetical protein F5887DRAFT_1019634 [Amanita rubescens]